MDHAHIVALDTTANLLKLPGLATNINFRVDKQCDPGHLKQIKGIVSVINEDHSYHLETNNPEESLAGLFKHAKECGFGLLDLQLHQPTLEDVFLKLTGHSVRQ